MASPCSTAGISLGNYVHCQQFWYNPTPLTRAAPVHVGKSILAVRAPRLGHPVRPSVYYRKTSLQLSIVYILIGAVWSEQRFVSDRWTLGVPSPSIAVAGRCSERRTRPLAQAWRGSGGSASNEASYGCRRPDNQRSSHAAAIRRGFHLSDWLDLPGRRCYAAIGLAAPFLPIERDCPRSSTWRSPTG